MSSLPCSQYQQCPFYSPTLTIDPGLATSRSGNGVREAERRPRANMWPRAAMSESPEIALQTSAKQREEARLLLTCPVDVPRREDQSHHQKRDIGKRGDAGGRREGERLLYEMLFRGPGSRATSVGAQKSCSLAWSLGLCWSVGCMASIAKRGGLPDRLPAITAQRCIRSAS